MFNWFRRKFGKDKEAETTQEQQSTPEPPQLVEETPAEEPESEASIDAPAEPTLSESEESGASDDQNLNWAQKVYRKFQDRKNDTPSTTEAASSPSALTSETLDTPQTTTTPEVTVDETAVPTIEEKQLDREIETTPEIISAVPPAPEVETPSPESVTSIPPTPEVETAPELVTSVPLAEEVDETITSDTAISESSTGEQTSEITSPESSSPMVEGKISSEEVDATPDLIKPITHATPVAPAPPPTETDLAEPEPQQPQPSATPSALQEELQDNIATDTDTDTDIDTDTDTDKAENTTPDIAFDDDFVWSAKVLEEQGRSVDEVDEGEISWLTKLRKGLGKTRRGIVNQLKAVVGQGPLDEESVMDIEALLLQADVGVEATDHIIETLQNKLKEGALPSDQAIAYLKGILRDILDNPLKQFSDNSFSPEKDTLNIWLLTGVNGAGKTTTIGKLAHMANQSGYRCMIAAADTFRAAAVEQVKVWGDRSGTMVIANPGKNTDPAAVVFDGIVAAQSREAELLLVDTAGRLQNKKNLMDELAKIRRIIDKKAPGSKVESLLVLDATLGQNGLRQAQVFSESAKLSGVVLTKLDGTAKGGVALAVAQQLNLPIRFIGAGEGIEDLRPFSSYEFVEALLNG